MSSLIMNPSTCCLICNSQFERKPTIISEEEEEDDDLCGGRGGGGGLGGHRQLEKFRTALLLFWKMLRAASDHHESGRRTQKMERGDDGDGGYFCLEEELKSVTGWRGRRRGDDDDDDESSLLLEAMLGPPCCSECYGALVSVLELQRVIDESQVSQKTHVRWLKGALESSPALEILDQNDFWGKVRRQLISCIVDSCTLEEIDNVDVAFHNDEDVDDDDDFYCPQDDPLDLEASEKDETVVTASKNSIIGQQGQPKDTTTTVVSPWSTSRSEKKRKRLRQKSQKIDAGREKRAKQGDHHELKERRGGGTRTSQLTTTTTADIKVRPCSVTLERIDVNQLLPKEAVVAVVNYEIKINPAASTIIPPSQKNGTTTATTTGEEEVEAVVENPKKIIPKGDSLHDLIGGKLRPHSKFLSIGNDYLLYHFTPVHFSFSSYCFKCLDGSDCPFTSEGCDASAFQRMANHIDCTHVPTENYSTSRRQCPLCHQILSRGSAFSSHVRATHSPTSVCQICWKPLVNATFYRYHLWTHKSEQEKADARAAGAPDMGAVMAVMLQRKRKREAKKSMRIKQARLKKKLRKEEEESSRRSHLQSTCSTTTTTTSSKKKTKVVKPQTDDNKGRAGHTHQQTHNVPELELDPQHQERLGVRQSKLRAVSAIRKSLRGGGGDSLEISSGSDNDDHDDNGESDSDRKCDIGKRKCKKEDEEFHPSADSNDEDDGDNAADSQSEDSDDADDVGEDLDESCSRDRRPRPTLPTRFFSNTLEITHRRHRPRSDAFFLVGSEHLLYKNTSIRISVSPQRLSCLEEGCSAGMIVGSTDYDAFQAMRHHVNHDHTEQDYAIKPRSCVLCPEQCDDGVYLKAHYVTAHPSQFKFVCEACWKPFPERGTQLNYKELLEHSWTHKSEEERRVGAAEAESSSYSSSKKRGGGGRRRSKNCSEDGGVVVVGVNGGGDGSQGGEEEETQNSSNNNSSDDDEEEENPSNNVRRRRRMRRRRANIDAFFLLGSGHLLYQYTTVGFSPHQGLTCLEEGCGGFETSGPPDYSSFQQMRYHVMDDHAENDYAYKPRSCILCTRRFADGISLKRHLSSRHRTSFTLMCHACGSPLPEKGHRGPLYFSARLRLAAHMMSHMSEAERKAVAEAEEEVKAGGRKGREKYNRRLQRLRRQAKRRKGDNVIWLLGGDKNHGHHQLLLFQSTLIKSSPQGFHCQQPSCIGGGGTGGGGTPVTVEGRDLSAFQKIKQHVISSHEDQDDDKIIEGGVVAGEEEGKGKSGHQLPCPMCAAVTVQDRLSLKEHLLQIHNQQMHSLCEVCWRPCAPNRATLEAHVLTHKSPQEKAATAVASGTSKKHRRTNEPVTEDNNTTDDDEGDGGDGEKGESKKRRRSLDMKKTAISSLKHYPDLFMVTTEELLLHKYTLVRISSEGRRLSCGEPGCGQGEESSQSFIRKGVVSESDFEGMRVHIREMHEDDDGVDYKTVSRTCPICSEVLETGHYFRRHVYRNHHFQRPVVMCEICCKPVLIPDRNKDLFVAHTWSHKNEVELDSAIQQFSPPATLLQLVEAEKRGGEAAAADHHHQLLFPTGPLPPTCDQCGKCFSTERYLELHRKTHLPRALRQQFVCEECGISLLSAVALRSHISRAHKPELQTKWRICPICSKRFHDRDGASYRLHVNSHGDARPFICEQCGAAFKDKSVLTSHARTHSQLKEFQCEYCERSYRCRTSLRRHQEAFHHPDEEQQQGEKTKTPNKKTSESHSHHQLSG